MFRIISRMVASGILLATVGVCAYAAPPEHAQNDKAIASLKAYKQGTEVSVSSATGTASFVRIPPGQAAKLSSGSLDDEAVAFVSRYAQAFGLRVGSTDLKLVKSETDSLGHTHVSFKQEYGGVPVFGASLKAHFDANGALAVVSGTLVPDLAVSLAPSRTQQDAEAIAEEWVLSEMDLDGAAATRSRLIVFREGLAKGVPGDNHLAYEVEVTNGVNVREFVYIDAHTGKFIDRISGINEAMFRRAYDGLGGSLAQVLTIWPDSPFWVEGDAFPTASAEANNMLLSSKETYDMFANAFGRDSFDGAGAIMDSIFNRGYSCPNASWNGAFISFCPGITTDDVTGHEWGHAYTDYTDNLIYQWQPGALNESYSDVVGETVDRINGRDDIVANGPRTPGSCSAFTTLAPTVTINTPASIAGVKRAGTAAFGPQAFDLTADIVVVDDGVAINNNGCESPFANAADVAGKIAFMDRGACAFTQKVKNAQDNGAIAAIIGNNTGGTAIINMAGADATITIPALSVVQNDGTAIKAEYAGAATVNATLSRGAVGSDNSTAWLMGEDSTAPGLVGALRDMWTPGCYGDPGKVTDQVYHCLTSDNGGVHRNSGIPNHAFALLVDGGSFNGQNINAIGLTKANHIYFRAKTHYQGPASDFADHADALEQSCADLTGTNLASLLDGSPSGDVISAADCGEVAKAMLAVEMRTPPDQCGFQPLLAKDPPPLCDNPGEKVKTLFADNFEYGASSTLRWTISHSGTTPDFTERDWLVVGNLPEDRAGKAFFGVDPLFGSCQPGGDESAVLHLDSPQIVVPTSASDLRIAFDHWHATELGWDGGNVKISVNDGPWQLIDFTSFIYNSYNVFLFSAQQGNTNPIAGEQAFSGSDGGKVDGSWGRSIIDLTGYAQPKDKIRLRFDIGTDGCNGAFGWYVDDVSVYQCR